MASETPTAQATLLLDGKSARIQEERIYKAMCDLSTPRQYRLYRRLSEMLEHISSDDEEQSERRLTTAKRQLLRRVEQEGLFSVVTK